MSDLTLQQVVLRVGAVLLIVSVHGAAVAVTACAMGDSGPREDGRLGLSPLRHLDLVGLLLAVLFTYGWIRPTAVDPARLRAGRTGLAVVLAAASGATVALVILLRLVRPFALNMLPDSAAATFFIFVQTVGHAGVAFALFNLLPMPPLTGQHLLVAIEPRRREAFRRAQPYCAALLVLLVVVGTVPRLLAPAQYAIERLILDD